MATTEHTPVTLHREINALGGTPSGSWSKGYNEAIGDVLDVLEKRGFSEAGDVEAELIEALVDLVSWFDGGPSSYGPWIINSGEYGADDAINAARAAIAKSTTPLTVEAGNAIEPKTGEMGNG